jgi:uncharacterized membrane protein
MPLVWLIDCLKSWHDLHEKVLKMNCVSFCSAAAVGKITLEMNKEMHVDVS